MNLADRWFCGLSIEDKLPDHSAFSRARNERFRRERTPFGEASVSSRPASPPGWLGGEGFAVVRASSRWTPTRSRPSIPEDWDRTGSPAKASRAVKEYLATRTSGPCRWPRRKPHHQGSPHTPSQHGSPSPGNGSCPIRCRGSTATCWRPPQSGSHRPQTLRRRQAGRDARLNDTLEMRRKMSLSRNRSLRARENAE